MHVSGKKDEIVEHFDQKHPENRQGEIGTELNLVNICKKEEIVMHLIKFSPYHFFVYLKTDPFQRKICMTVQLVGTYFSASKWIYEIQVYVKREPRRKLTYSDICYSHTTPVDDIFRESKCVTISMEHAMTYFSEGTWTYKIFLRKDLETGNRVGRGRGRGRGKCRGGSNKS